MGEGHATQKTSCVQVAWARHIFGLGSFLLQSEPQGPQGSELKLCGLKGPAGALQNKKRKAFHLVPSLQASSNKQKKHRCLPVRRTCKRSLCFFLGEGVGEGVEVFLGDPAGAPQAATQDSRSSKNMWKGLPANAPTAATRQQEQQSHLESNTAGALTPASYTHSRKNL